MSLTPEERKVLIKHRLNEANDTIQDVQLLLDNGRLRAAVNRIYYGMFYSLLALGLANEFETSKHQQLLGWFNKTFIHEGLIDSKFGKIINKAFIRRTQGDYDSFVDFDSDGVLEMFDEMKQFITEIDLFLGEKFHD
jgi:uncharacterized protein (UPF0332 family)